MWVRQRSMWKFIERKKYFIRNKLIFDFFNIRSYNKLVLLIRKQLFGITFFLFFYQLHAIYGRDSFVWLRRH